MRLKYATLAAAVALALATATPALAGRSEKVEGTWSSVSDRSAACTSPILVCRTGVLYDRHGDQAATFYFTMQTLAPQPDGSVAFTGYEVETYADGSTISADDQGTMTPHVGGPSDVFVTITITSGTGVYADATGALTAQGTLDPATDQASGTYGGRIRRA